MSRFDFSATRFAGLTLIQRKPIADMRGFLARVYCAEEFREVGWSKSVAQVNHTLTRRSGAVRGLHFQSPPYMESKLVSCLKGQIFDVAVDLRRNSPTFLQWYGEMLSADNYRSLLIPEGFAHGFQTLTDDCELIYLHTTPYHPEAESALNVEDPRLAIAWPLPITELSERDRAHPFIGADYSGINR